MSDGYAFAANVVARCSQRVAQDTARANPRGEALSVGLFGSRAADAGSRMSEVLVQHVRRSRAHAMESVTPVPIESLCASVRSEPATLRTIVTLLSRRGTSPQAARNE